MKGIKNVFLLSSIIFFPLTVSLIIVLESSSVFTFVFFLFAALLLQKLFLGEITKEIIITYGYYSFFAICYAAFQFITIGEYFELGGNIEQIGSDDVMFSSEALTGVPFVGHVSLHNYSSFLRTFAIFLSKFKEPNHIDLVLVNVLAISFVPIILSRLSFLLLLDIEVSYRAFLFTLLCPLLLVCSIVLYREAWVTLFFVGTIYFIFCKRYSYALLFLIGSLQLRMGGGVLLLFLSCIILYNQIQGSANSYFVRSCIALLLFVTVGFVLYIGAPFFLEYFTEKMAGDIFFRSSFVDHLVTSASERNIESGMSALYNAPFPIRIIGGFLFFLVAPTLSFKYLYSVHGIFWLSQFMLLVFPFMMLLYLVWFIRGCTHAISKNNKSIILVIIIFLVSILFLAQLSLQVRHKSMVMPLFYLIVSYGVYFGGKLATHLGVLASACLFILQFIYISMQYIR